MAELQNDLREAASIETGTPLAVIVHDLVLTY